MIRDFVAFFLKRLNDESSIDQVLEGCVPRLPQLFFQFLAGVLRTQQLLPWRRQHSDLRIGDHIPIYNRSDAVYYFGLCPECGTAKR